MLDRVVKITNVGAYKDCHASANEILSSPGLLSERPAANASTNPQIVSLPASPGLVSGVQESKYGCSSQSTSRWERPFAEVEVKMTLF